MSSIKRLNPPKKGKPKKTESGATKSIKLIDVNIESSNEIDIPPLNKPKKISMDFTDKVDVPVISKPKKKETAVSLSVPKVGIPKKRESGG